MTLNQAKLIDFLYYFPMNIIDKKYYVYNCCAGQVYNNLSVTVKKKWPEGHFGIFGYKAYLPRKFRLLERKRRH